MTTACCPLAIEDDYCAIINIMAVGHTTYIENSNLTLHDIMEAHYLLRTRFRLDQ